MPIRPSSAFFGAPYWDLIEDGYEEDLGAITSPWDILYLDGVRVPGVVESISVVPKMLIHIGKRSGADGGPTVERGHEAARIEIGQKLWTPMQWLRWQQLKAKIWRGPGQTPRTRVVSKGDKPPGAVTIGHPACAEARIFGIIFESIISPEPGKEVGARVVKMKCVQYIPASTKKPLSKEPYALKTVAPAAAGIQTGVPAKTQSEQPVPARDRATP